MTKFAPTPTPETTAFWDGTRRGELRLQRCNACRSVTYPPRPFCPVCHSRAMEWFKASGDAQLYSYVINYRSRPDWPSDPYSIALVQLKEGPLMVSNIIGCPQTPEALVLNMPLRVDFERIDDVITLPVFRPAMQVSL